jgi:hypothetical protein
LAVVKQDEADGETVERALDPRGAGLSEPHRLAVVMADALMTRPSDIDDATVEGLRQHFSNDQLVEMTLKVLKFNIQKVLVALGTHATIGPEQINKVRWNQLGTYVVADQDSSARGVTVEPFGPRTEE